MTEAFADMRRTRRASLWLCLLVASGLILVAAANAHLFYVASISQPSCVAHLRQGETTNQSGRFAAADSSCASPLSPAPAKARE
jgi:hypothetical protein